MISNRTHNRDLMEEVKEANQTNRLGKQIPAKEAKLLAGAFATITQHKAWANPKKQKELIARVKQRYGFK